MFVKHQLTAVTFFLSCPVAPETQTLDGVKVKAVLRLNRE